MTLRIMIVLAGTTDASDLSDEAELKGLCSHHFILKMQRCRGVCGRLGNYSLRIIRFSRHEFRSRMLWSAGTHDYQPCRKEDAQAFLAPSQVGSYAVSHIDR